MRVLIVGAGGHGQVVADILLSRQSRDHSVEPVGYLDDNRNLKGKDFLGLPVLGTIDALPDVAHDAIIVAIGDNKARQQVFEVLGSRGEKIISAVHPNVTIARNVEIGPGTMVCAGVIINPCNTIGRDVILNTGCSVDHHSWIADHAHIAPGVHLGGGVNIGEGTLVGIGVSVLPGCRIGAWSVVGAGAVVTEDIPDEVTVIGVPAKGRQQRTG